jgi:hypothetical protein
MGKVTVYRFHGHNRPTWAVIYGEATRDTAAGFVLGKRAPDQDW